MSEPMTDEILDVYEEGGSTREIRLCREIRRLKEENERLKNARKVALNEALFWAEKYEQARELLGKVLRDELWTRDEIRTLLGEKPC